MNVSELKISTNADEFSQYRAEIGMYTVTCRIDVMDDGSMLAEVEVLKPNGENWMAGEYGIEMNSYFTYDGLEDLHLPNHIAGKVEEFVEACREFNQ